MAVFSINFSADGVAVTGPQGPEGDLGGNIDGGVPNTEYGGTELIDSGEI
jgi:hypothetical protein